MQPLSTWYLRLALLTTILLGMVVLAGSVVRATGSGMGCPDWPKCFGRLIPPTDVSQLPPDYQTRYPGQEIAPFSAFKTWTEYSNRLLGALSGVALLATVLASFRFWKQDRRTPLLLLGTMILASVVIWLGKTVVDQNLHPRQVTIHMLGGLLLVMGSVIASARVTHRAPTLLAPALRKSLWICLVLVISQILVGTQMREQVDRLLTAGNCCAARTDLETSLGGVYLLHRLLASLTAVAVGVTFLRFRFAAGRPLPRLNLVLGASIGLSYLVGVLLVRWQLPALLQPAHLCLGTLTLGLLVSMLTCSVVAPENGAA